MFKNGVPEGTTNISDANMKEGAIGSVASEASQVTSIASETVAKPARKRIPMSVPNRRLEIEEIPGFRLYWFKEINVLRAKAAGYELVLAEECYLNHGDVGSSSDLSGNTDLGGNVSIVHGVGTNNQPERLVLMKLPIEYFKNDQMDIALANATRIANVFDGEQLIGQDGEINERGALVYTPSEGANVRTSGRGEFKPVFNRPKRTLNQGRGRRTSVY